MRYQLLRCNNDGTYTPVEKAYIDGYSFGDRLLEGVMFEVRVVGDDITVEAAARSKRYFEDLNKEKWLKAAKKSALQHDFLESTEDGDGDDIILYDWSKPHNMQSASFEKEPVIKE